MGSTALGGLPTNPLWRRAVALLENHRKTAPWPIRHPNCQIQRWDLVTGRDALELKQFISAAIFGGVLSIAAIATASAHEDHGTSQWPTTCVDLNDVIETQLGNHGNVGIYQRTFGDQAEAACQNDHRNDVQATFSWALDTPAYPAVGEPPPGGWPTTCIGMNDTVEAHLNRPGNVGIYQRAFGGGPDAEQACRRDHRDDTRAAFAWLLAESTPSVPATPIDVGPPGPVSALAMGDCARLDHPTPQLHWYHCSRSGADAGYSRAVWVEIHPPLEGGGLVPHGYRGTLTGGPQHDTRVSRTGIGISRRAFRLTWGHLELGSYTYTVNAFNEAGDGPPVSLDFHVGTLPAEVPSPGYWDPRLREVAEYLKSSLPFFADSVDAMIAEGLRAFFGDVGEGRTAFYAPSKDMIVVDSQYRHARQQGLAPLLAYELWHAFYRGPGRALVTTIEDCYRDEIRATRVQAEMWEVMGPPQPQSDLERSHDNIYQHYREGSLDTAVRMANQEWCSYYGR